MNGKCKLSKFPRNSAHKRALRRHLRRSLREELYEFLHEPDVGAFVEQTLQPVGLTQYFSRETLYWAARCVAAEEAVRRLSTPHPSASMLIELERSLDANAGSTLWCERYRSAADDLARALMTGLPWHTSFHDEPQIAVNSVARLSAIPQVAGSPFRKAVLAAIGAAARCRAGDMLRSEAMTLLLWANLVTEKWIMDGLLQLGPEVAERLLGENMVTNTLKAAGDLKKALLQ